MYQENELVRCHVEMGHEVLIIASTQIYAKEAGRRVHVRAGVYHTVPGARLVRVPYWSPFSDRVMRKIRAYRGVRKLLEEFSPDSLVFHGTSAFELLGVARYAASRPNMLFYIDNHTDQYNSGRNFLSHLIHRFYYGPILRHAVKRARTVLCNTKDGMEFLEKVYGVPGSAVEYFPLGGRMPEEKEYERRRERGRGRYQVGADQILIVQAGKQTREKRLEESLEAVRAVGPGNVRFVIAGSLDETMAPIVDGYLKSRNFIQWVGWLGAEELLDLLCAADIYLQPGTQSVTLQQSLCCRCAVVIRSYLSHDMYVNGNGFIIGRDGSLPEILERLKASDLKAMGEQSYQIAREHLDYRKLARRLLQ